MQTVEAEVVENIAELHGFIDKVSGGEQRADVRLAVGVDHLFQIVAGVQDADDVVDLVLIHGDARVALADDQVMDLFGIVVDVNNGDVNAGGQDLLRGLFVKLQRRLHQLALLLLEDAFFLNVLDNHLELVLGDGGGGLFDARELHK